MANLADGTIVAGNLVGNANSTIAAYGGTGFSNMVRLTTPSLNWVYTFPAELRVPGKKFKVTLLGAGGYGGASGSAGGACGGMSGGLCMVWLTVQSPYYSANVFIGASLSPYSANGQTRITYAGETFTGQVGPKGQDGSAGGVGNSRSAVAMSSYTSSSTVFQIEPFLGGGGGASCPATYTVDGRGADAPLGLGLGGGHGDGFAGGSAGTGYGSGGGGVLNGVGTGGIGGSGLIIIEY